MKRLRFLSGEGNGSAIIPDGSQALDISMVPGTNGSWVQIAESKPIWVPPESTFEIGALELGAWVCGPVSVCDMWPGEVQVAIVFGQDVDGLQARDILGDEPLSWFVIYTGCW